MVMKPRRTHRCRPGQPAAGGGGHDLGVARGGDVGLGVAVAVVAPERMVGKQRSNVRGEFAEALRIRGLVYLGDRTATAGALDAGSPDS